MDEKKEFIRSGGGLLREKEEGKIGVVAALQGSEVAAEGQSPRF